MINKAFADCLASVHNLRDAAEREVNRNEFAVDSLRGMVRSRDEMIVRLEALIKQLRDQGPRPLTEVLIELDRVDECNETVIDNPAHRDNK